MDTKKGIILKSYSRNGMTLFLTPRLVIVEYGRNRQYLKATHSSWNRRMMMIRRMIELEKIEDYAHLVSFCRLHDNYGSIQMIPIEMIHTDLSVDTLATPLLKKSRQSA